MDIFPDVSSAVSEKITSRRRYVQLLKLSSRRDLIISACLKINIIQRIVMGREACSDLVVDLLLTGSLLFGFSSFVF